MRWFFVIALVLGAAASAKADFMYQGFTLEARVTAPSAQEQRVSYSVSAMTPDPFHEEISIDELDGGATTVDYHVDATSGFFELTVDASSSGKGSADGYWAVAANNDLNAGIDICVTAAGSGYVYGGFGEPENFRLWEETNPSNYQKPLTTGVGVDEAVELRWRADGPLHVSALSSHSPPFPATRTATRWLICPT